MNPAAKRTLRKIEHLLLIPADQIVGTCIDVFHKDPGRVRKILADSNNLPYSGSIQLRDERLELTATAILNDKKERIGAMANWDLVTTKKNLEDSLKETVASVAASTEILASSGNEMSATVNEISMNLQKASETTSKAVAMTETMNQKINQLESASSEIGNVMKVISSIAAQTNLLALNATIEAARAGDAGKGFAVVANEVKDLAKGTAKATEEIQSHISAIQSNTKDAVETIGEITAIIRENDEITTSISGAVEEQSVTTNEMSRNMEQTSQGTEKIVQALTEVLEL